MARSMAFARTLTLALALTAVSIESAVAFEFSDVEAKAKALAAQPYNAPKPVPEFLRRPNFNYDQHRDIRFIREKSLWRGTSSNFEAQLFHPGFVYEYGVDLNLVDGKETRALTLDPTLFNYGKNNIGDKLPSDLGYAGFRLHFPIKSRQYFDEVVTFAGASYFRAVSRDTLYGLSARGLAVDTGLPSGEEFPIFREFWLKQPTPQSKSARIYALLDGPRVTGAYEFNINPGKTTATHVKAAIFQREKVKELGIAPLTSMFYYGENTRRPHGEWRPEVHDSDGLFLINGNGERIWRPLSNEARLRLISFSLENPRGFGLFQRDRDFASYEDLETHMEQRPNAWVVPVGDWGKGYVKLTEIPTNSEYNDNIVAYWVPETTPEPGTPLRVEYRIDWSSELPAIEPKALVHATRTGFDFDDAGKPKNRRVLVDFVGDQLKRLGPDAKIEPDITIGAGGELIEKHLTWNKVTQGWRLSFALNTEKDKPVELRAFLKSQGTTLSETWTYLLEPPPLEK
ncbi:MAG: glucan biosynthesis protein [Thiotrichales bacterium]